MVAEAASEEEVSVAASAEVPRGEAALPAAGKIRKDIEVIIVPDFVVVLRRFIKPIGL